MAENEDDEAARKGGKNPPAKNAILLEVGDFLWLPLLNLGLQDTFYYHPLKFNSEFTTEKLPGPNRKGESLPTTIFQGRAVKLRGCIQFE